MKLHLKTLALACFSFFLEFGHAQKPFAKIEKNYNVQAKGLYHNLNATKDTLLLKSDKKINYVYTINRAIKRELSYTVNANEFKVPLDKLSNGKHVFVAVLSPVRIVFVVKVFGNELLDLTDEDIELAVSGPNN